MAGTGDESRSIGRQRAQKEYTEWIEKLKGELTAFDYVRLTWTDLGGRARGFIVTARNADDYIKNGASSYSGALTMGPMSEMPILLEKTQGYQRATTALPAAGTLHNLEWVGGEIYKVAEVLCETHWQVDLSPQFACPRYAARVQIGRLRDKFGMVIRSSFEQVFRLEDKKGNPMHNGHEINNHIQLAYNEEMFFDLEKKMQKSDIDIVRIRTGYSPGQYEVILKQQYNIKSVDSAFIFKQGIKEMASKRDFVANYMGMPVFWYTGSSMHFNHSLWYNKNLGAFYDKNDSLNLSDNLKHWLAGLVRHAPAITAFCCPTVNCYRRLIDTKADTPTKATWGIENKSAAFRVKNYGADNTYIECRIPSGLSNPYLVMAAIVAAGIDGIEKQYELTPEYDYIADQLPKSLDTALKALEKDVILCKDLGSELVTWFIESKRQIDLIKLQDSNVEDNFQEELDLERAMYAQFV